MLQFDGHFVAYLLLLMMEWLKHFPSSQNAQIPKKS